MELFTTNIRLKPNCTRLAILDILKEWLINSPHYGINELNYSDQEVFSADFGACSVNIISTTITSCLVFALRFSNKEEHNVWITDCIYTETGKEKCISITLSCHSNDYSSVLPRIHKPYIVKKIIESGLCYQDEFFPINDLPIYLQNTDLSTCADIMCGKAKTNLPIVYISFDSFNSKHYSVDEKLLAIKLSGLAHVLVEPSKEFALELKEKANGNNAYNGYVGIYFSQSKYKDLISQYDFYNDGCFDRNKMENAIRATLQQAVLNRHNISDFTWNSIQIALHRKNYEAQEKSSIQMKKDLDDFINVFDDDLKKKDETIQRLQTQLEIQNSIIESFKSKMTTESTLTFDKGEIDEFYMGELNDLIITLLSQLTDRLSDNTRQKDLLTSFLGVNKTLGNGERIFEDLEKALQEKNLASRRSILEKCGFTVEISGHDKIQFHSPKYCFSLPNSPSDFRSMNNMYKDILKKISVYKKIL